MYLFYSYLLIFLKKILISFYVISFAWFEFCCSAESQISKYGCSSFHFLAQLTPDKAKKLSGKFKIICPFICLFICLSSVFGNDFIKFSELDSVRGEAQQQDRTFRLPPQALCPWASSYISWNLNWWVAASWFVMLMNRWNHIIVLNK